MGAPLELPVTITRANGLHARVAATLVKLAADALDQYGIRVLVRQGHRTVPAENLYSLISLGLREGQTVSLVLDAAPDLSRETLLHTAERMRRLLTEADTQVESAAQEAVDAIIHQATFTLDRVVENLANGLIVVNAQNEIVLFNRAAERYLGLEAEAVLGRNADEVIPNSRLSRVLRTGQPEVARTQVAGGVTLVTNRTPIRLDGRVIGCAAVFQDISELERVAGELQTFRALKEQFTLLLDAAAEGICVLNREGVVQFANAAFRRLFGDPPQFSAQSPILRVLRSGRSVAGEVDTTPDGASMVVDVHAIRVGVEVQGVLAICRSADVVRELAHRLEQQEARAAYLEQELARSRPLPSAFSRLVGSSGALREALTAAAKAAQSTSTILIRGESGTGKDLVAEAIHLASPRARGPFVRLNCAAIPPGLVESELFGHEKGSFTGATRRRLGKFELANGGTIFLDEIGTLDITVQAKLLRTLQNRELERIGGERPIPIDVRVIAATNADLEEMVGRNEFREDLYYRLNVVTLYLPPLRERRSDIPLLVEHFIAKLQERVGRRVDGITPEAMQALMAYDWPGNVRQLENVIERALNLCECRMITRSDLPRYVTGADAAPALVNALPDGSVAPLEAYEREIIRLALARYGSFDAAARALGVTHRTVANKARRYGLVGERGIPGAECFPEGCKKYPALAVGLIKSIKPPFHGEQGLIFAKGLLEPAADLVGCGGMPLACFHSADSRVGLDG